MKDFVKMIKRLMSADKVGKHFSSVRSDRNQDGHMVITFTQPALGYQMFCVVSDRELRLNPEDKQRESLAKAKVRNAIMTAKATYHFDGIAA